MATTEDILALVQSLPDLSGISFPSAKDVTIKRMEAAGGTITEESLEALTPTSPAVIAAGMEIALLKAQLNVLIGQLPLLAFPVTIPMALPVVKALLPSVIELLVGLDIPIPEALTPLIEALDLAQSIIDTASDALITPLDVLGDILGIKHS